MAYQMERLEMIQEWEVLASLAWPCRKDSVDLNLADKMSTRHDTVCHKHVHVFLKPDVCFIQAFY